MEDFMESIRQGDRVQRIIKAFWVLIKVNSGL